jgi:hypothetical protein
MFAPLSEHIENKLDKAFCKAYSLYGTYDDPAAWEDYKLAFAEWLIQGFKEETSKKEFPTDWS